MKFRSLLLILLICAHRFTPIARAESCQCNIKESLRFHELNVKSMSPEYLMVRLDALFSDAWSITLDATLQLRCAATLTPEQVKCIDDKLADAHHALDTIKTAKSKLPLSLQDAIINRKEWVAKVRDVYTKAYETHKSLVETATKAMQCVDASEPACEAIKTDYTAYRSCSHVCPAPPPPKVVEIEVCKQTTANDGLKDESTEELVDESMDDDDEDTELVSEDSKVNDESTSKGELAEETQAPSTPPAVSAEIPAPISIPNAEVPAGQPDATLNADAPVEKPTLNADVPAAEPTLNAEAPTTEPTPVPNSSATEPTLNAETPAIESTPNLDAPTTEPTLNVETSAVVEAPKADVPAAEPIPSAVVDQPPAAESAPTIGEEPVAEKLDGPDGSQSSAPEQIESTMSIIAPQPETLARESISQAVEPEQSPTDASPTEIEETETKLPSDEPPEVAQTLGPETPSIEQPAPEAPSTAPVPAFEPNQSIPERAPASEVSQ